MGTSVPQSEIDGPGAEKPTELMGYHSHSICPNDLEDEATTFWMEFFREECSIAEKHVDLELKDAIASAVAVPIEDPDNVRCTVKANCQLESASLIFEIKQGQDVFSNWDAVKTSAKLLQAEGGGIESKGHDEDMDESGVCNIFESTIPRTFPLTADALSTLFNLYRNEYKHACPSALNMSISDTTIQHTATKTSLEGTVGWDTRFKVTAETDATVHLFYSESGPSTYEINFKKTDPTPCSLCNRCTGSGLFEKNRIRDHSGHEAASVTVDDAKEHLAELREHRLHNSGKSPMAMEEIWEETKYWRHQLAAARRHGTKDFSDPSPFAVHVIEKEKESQKKR
jgi:hypothetical protein